MVLHIHTIGPPYPYYRSSISILYGRAFKPFLGRVAVFISICIYYSHIYLSSFGCTSLSSNDSNGIGRTIYLSSMDGALLVYSF